MRQTWSHLAVAVSLLASSLWAFGQQAKTTQSEPATAHFTAAELAAKVPAPKSEDVKSVDAIVAAAYAAISGPAGARDWDRFRSLFLPEARFTSVGKEQDGSTVISSWSVDEFVRDAGAAFAKEGFYENGIVNKPDTYGGMTQVLSSYESRHAPGEKPFARGVNSFQVVNDGKRYWILSIFWDSERPDNPLPTALSRK